MRYQRCLTSYFFIGAVLILLVLSGCTVSRNISKGIGYMRYHDIDSAIEAFNRAVEADPEFSEAYYHRGNAWALKNDFEKAASDFSRAIELDCDYAEAYLARAAVLIQQSGGKDEKITEGALADLTRAIECDPDLVNAYILRGLIYKNKDELEKALADFNQTIEVAPEKAYEGYLNRGMVFKQMGKTEKALLDFNRAISVNSFNDPVVYIQRAEIRLSQNRYDEAIEDCQKALRIFPLMASAYRIRGDALMGKKDYDLAIWSYSEAIDIDWDDALLYARRGEAWRKAGKTDEACKDFNKCCRLVDCGQMDFQDWRQQHCRKND